jgi:hypothetical protein
LPLPNSTHRCPHERLDNRRKALEDWTARVAEAQRPSPAENFAWQQDQLFVPQNEDAPEELPALRNISAGMMYEGMIRPVKLETPQFVTIPVDDGPRSIALENAISMWNMLWEAGQFRRRFFSEEDLPAPIAKLADLGDINLTFVPRSRSRYFEYAPLYHLLPKATLSRAGLPRIRSGTWPFTADWGEIDRHLPATFRRSLAEAWARTVWPYLISGSRVDAFSDADPIRILAHNLDFWVPAVTDIVQDILGTFPEVDKGKTTGPVRLVDGSYLNEAVAGNPRMGGTIWEGEEEAAEVVAAVVEAADEAGGLRSIIDAVRSNRVEDDFSDRWSYEKEDFERKLYSKRRKVRVRFVELDDTTPVQAPESDLSGNIVTSDFLALLDREQRQIVVLLSSGLRQYEVAEHLGYANHSSISKRLAQIRKEAERYFELC